MDEEETLLAGGNLSAVVRIGDTVRRPLRPWSAAVHGLLRHLEARGVDGRPRFLGIDDRGREILTFISGRSRRLSAGGPRCGPTTPSPARHGYCGDCHDATLYYVAPVEAAWQFVYPDPAHHEVICHNDVAPYNTVFVDGQATGVYRLRHRRTRAADLGPRLCRLHLCAAGELYPGCRRPRRPL